MRSARVWEAMWQGEQYLHERGLWMDLTLRPSSASWSSVTSGPQVLDLPSEDVNPHLPSPQGL